MFGILTWWSQDKFRIMPSEVIWHSVVAVLICYTPWQLPGYPCPKKVQWYISAGGTNSGCLANSDLTWKQKSHFHTMNWSNTNLLSLKELAIAIVICMWVHILIHKANQLSVVLLPNMNKFPFKYCLKCCIKLKNW